MRFSRYLSFASEDEHRVRTHRCATIHRVLVPTIKNDSAGEESSNAKREIFNTFLVFSVIKCICTISAANFRH